MTRCKAIALTVCFAFLAGCGSSATTSNNNQPLAGNWVGTANDNSSGTGTFTATLAQNGANVVGTWHIVFPTAGYDNSGSVVGIATGSSLVATLSPSVPTYCPFNLVVSVTATTMTGSYAAFNCTAVVAGSVTAHK